MNKNFKRSTQGGFTLIELIVVIVILGILAATALPKFANLSGDARVASLNAAKGSLASVSAMAHGQFLVNPANNGLSSTMEGTTFAMANGYPTGSTGLAAAAGLAATDYTITAAPNGATLTISPVGVTTPANCSVVYTAATANANGAVTPPTVALSAATPDCN